VPPFPKDEPQVQRQVGSKVKREEGSAEDAAVAPALSKKPRAGVFKTWELWHAVLASAAVQSDTDTPVASIERLASAAAGAVSGSSGGAPSGDTVFAFTMPAGCYGFGDPCYFVSPGTNETAIMLQHDGGNADHMQLLGGRVRHMRGASEEAAEDGYMALTNTLIGDGLFNTTLKTAEGIKYSIGVDSGVFGLVQDALWDYTCHMYGSGRGLRCMEETTKSIESCTPVEVRHVVNREKGTSLVTITFTKPWGTEPDTWTIDLGRGEPLDDDSEEDDDEEGRDDSAPPVFQ